MQPSACQLTPAVYMYYILAMALTAALSGVVLVCKSVCNALKMMMVHLLGVAYMAAVQFTDI